MPTIWCMNLKDNRDESNNRNWDGELKFRLCRERSMIAIGWCVPYVVNTWEEYKKIANDITFYGKGYVTARNNLERIKKGDLVWIKNPTTEDRYLVEIEDGHPGIYGSLKEFDTCAYRKGKFYAVDNSLLIGALSAKRLRARYTLERVHEYTRGDTIKETIKLFKELKIK